MFVAMRIRKCVSRLLTLHLQAVYIKELSKAAQFNVAPLPAANARLKLTQSQSTMSLR
jgi:hypothetical protein